MTVLNRRRFLELSSAAGAGLLVPSAGEDYELEKYVDPLPRLGVLDPYAKVGGASFYEVHMTQTLQKLHRDLPPTAVWAYGGQYPGKTIEARAGEPIQVTWVNDLPQKHLFAVDPTLHGAGPGTPEVRAVVHLHGGRVSPTNDGFPESWFLPGGSRTCAYPNKQRAATLWVHDHAMAITRLNVYAGLAGFYLIRDAEEDALGLPDGDHEIPLLIQDRSFGPDGQLVYPVSEDPNAPYVPELFADTIVVNGKVWPYLEVEPRRYRFRILNGSNGRFYNLRMSDGPSLYQIGNDGGLLPAPALLTELLLAPGERADVLLDFSSHEGEELILENSAPDASFGTNPATTGQILQFRVNQPLSSPDTSALPLSLPAVPELSPASAVAVRDLSLDAAMDPHVAGRMIMLLNGMRWMDPVTEKPVLGSTEIWRFINTTIDTHPMHLHLVQFQVLDRTPYDVARYLTDKANKALGPLESYFTGPPVPPDDNERGFKDTARANPGEVTRIIARFDGFAGKFVWHCHVLEHEDHDMMRPFEVVAKGLRTSR